MMTWQPLSTAQGGGVSQFMITEHLMANDLMTGVMTTQRLCGQAWFDMAIELY